MPAKTTKKPTTAPNKPLVEMMMEQVDFQKLIEDNRPLIQKQADQALKDVIRNLDFSDIIYEARDAAFDRIQGQIETRMSQAMLAAFAPRG